MTKLVALRDIVEQSTGTRNPTTFPSEEFIYVDVAAVDNHEKVISGARSVLGAQAPSRARKLIRHKDILVSTVRPNLNAVALVPASLDGQVASTGFCVLRPKHSVLPEYLFFYVRSLGFINSLISLVAGALYPAVSDSQILEQQLALPSLDEQRRIIDLLSRAEGIIRLRREAQKKAQAIIPALFLDMFGDPAVNHKRWEVATLGKFVFIPSVVRTPDLQADADYLCIGSDSIESNTGSFLTCHTVRDIIPKSGKYWFEAGDVLYSKIRPYLAKVALTKIHGYCSADMYPLRCRKPLEPRFLLSFLLSKAFTEFAIAESVRAQMPKLNRESLFNHCFPLPPESLQRHFALLADQSQAVLDQQVAATMKAEATFNALLFKAFAPSQVAVVATAHPNS